MNQLKRFKYDLSKFYIKKILFSEFVNIANKIKAKEESYECVEKLRSRNTVFENKRNSSK